MSKTIDERVVVLRFDNAQFESATKESMTTLDKLKSSLKMDKSAKSLDELGKSAKGFNLNDMANAVDTVNKRFSALGVAGMTVISNLTNSAMGFAKNVLTAIPNQIIHGGWRRAENIEQAKFQIEGLGKVWDSTSEKFQEGMEDVDTISYWVNQAVDGTAYGLDEAAKVAAQFAASGIDAGEDMGEALRAISGAAAMTGSSYEDMGNIFTTVAGNGRIMGQQLLQISGKGLNAAATIKDYMNGVTNGSIEATDAIKEYVNQLTGGVEITEQDLRDMVSKGVITFDLFYKAMNNAFGEHAAKANDTFSGSLSNVKSALSRIGADVAEVKLEELKNIFNAIRPVINATRWALQPLIITFNRLSFAASTKLAEGVTKIGVALDGIFTEKGKKLHNDWEEEFNGLKKNANEALKAIAESGNEAKEVDRKYQPLVNSVNSFKNVFSSIKNVFSGLKSVVSPVFLGFKDGIQNAFNSRGFLLFTGKIKILTDRLKEFTSSLGISGETAEKIRGKISSGFQAFADFFKNSEAFQHLSRSLKTLFSNMGGGIKNFFGGVKDFFVQVGQSEGFQHLKEQLSGLWEVIKQIGADKIEALAKLIDRISGFKLEGTFKENAVKVFSNFSEVLAGLVENLKNGTANVHDFFSGLKGEGDGSKIANLTEKFTAFKDAVGVIGGDTLDKLKKFFNTESWQGWDLSGAKEGLKAFFDWIATVDWERLIDIIGKIAKLIVGLQIGNAFRKVLNSWESIGWKLSKIFGNFALFPPPNKFENFRTIAMSILMLSTSLLIISKIPADDLKRSLITLGIVVGAMVAVVKILGTKLSKNAVEKELDKIAKIFLSMGVSMILIAAALRIISKMSGEEIAKAGLVIAGLIGMFVAASKLLGNGFKAGGIVALAFAVNLLVIPLGILGKMKWSTILKGVISIGLIMGELVIAANIADGVKGGAATLIGLATAVMLMTIPLMIIGKMKVGNIVKSIAAITFIMAELVIAANLADGVKGGGATMIALAGSLLIISAALVALSLIRPARLLSSVLAMSVIMAELVVVSRLAKKAEAGALMISGVLIVVTGALLLLSVIPYKKLLAEAASLSAVMVAIGVTLKLMSGMNIATAAQAALAFSVGMGIIIGALTAILVGLGALATKFDRMGEFIDKGGEILGKLGSAIGQFIGGIASGIGAGVGEALTSAGEGLSNFAESAQPFIDTMKTVDDSVVDGVLALSKAILAITGTEFLNGLSQLGSTVFSGLTQLFGGEDLSFGEQIIQFAKDFKGFADEVADIPEDSINKATLVAQALEALSTGAPNTSGGLLGLITGGTDFSELGTQLQSFGEGFKEFAGFLDEVPDTVGAKSEILSKALIALQDAPNTAGGFLGMIMGTTDFSTLGENLKTFGEGFSTFAGYLDGIPDGVGEKAETLSAILQALQDAPYTDGGLLGALKGSTDFTTLGTNLSDLSAGLLVFVNRISTFPEDLGGRVEIFRRIMESLGAADIDTSKGLWGYLTGSTTLGELADSLGAFGQGLADFANNLAGADMGNVSAMTAMLPSLGNGMSSFNKDAVSTMQSLTTTLPDFGTALGTFYDEIKELSGADIDTIVSNIQSIVGATDGLNLSGFSNAGSTAAANLANGFSSASRAFTASVKKVMASAIKTVSSYSKNFKNAGQTSINNFVAGMNQSVNRVKAVASTMVSRFVNGITSGKSRASSAGRTLAKSAASGAGNVSLYSTGSDFVKGFANGITANTFRAKAAATTMAKKAKQAAEDALGIESPSRELFKTGMYVVMGFANGISHYTRLSEKASEEMATDALSSVRNTVGIISNLFNEDLNAQPTITPVVDLSNVHASAASISSLLTDNQGISITGSITSDMNMARGSDPLAKLSKRLDKVADSMKTRPITNNITVNGAENPEAFADRFVRKLKLDMRAT